MLGARHAADGRDEIGGALAAYGVCGAVLAGISAPLEPPSLYLALLPDIQRYTIGFSPKTMLGLRGLCTSLGWTAAYPAAALALSAYLLVMSRRMEFARGFGMIVTACVLCAYHATWYDGAVLALPFGLALARGDPGLRMMTACLMMIPFWNVMSAFVTALPLGFAMLYPAVPGRAAPQSDNGSGASARPANVYEK
jgi:hypothetical protein